MANNHFNQLPSLKYLKGFEATARLNNASRAAEELHVTPPAITHQIQSLEQSLGINLFEREGRKLILTEAGKMFYPFVLEALTAVKSGVDALHRSENKPDPLKIQAYITAAIRWLGPKLSGFQRLHPEVQIKLDSSTGWEFDHEHSDLGFIFLDSPPEAKYCWQPLFPYELTPVCTPELLEQLGPSPKPEDLLTLPLLSIHTEGQHWEMWLDSVGVCSDNLNPAITVDTLAISLEMALNGEGVSLVNGPFAQRELEKGSLVQPFTQRCALGDWGVIYPKDSPKLEQIQSFLTWLNTEV